jgi:hypothetical protein
MEHTQVDIAFIYEHFLAEAEMLLEQWRCRPEGSGGSDSSRQIEAMGDL